jgi:steroid 5-alpha reductase family enzyme
MFDWQLWWPALLVLLAMGAATWLLSIPLRNVSIVDSVWSVLIAAAGVTYAIDAAALSLRSWLVLALLAAWALRLAIFITARNHGHGEDRRYQAIRARNQPNFAFKSLYLVFGLQALLAWVVSLPLLGALSVARPLRWLDGVGAAVVISGLLWESIGDTQLARFKSDVGSAGQVMDRGLWRYSRHPNYFGECCVWWGFYVIAWSGGSWWAIASPVLMTVLLLKVSGVGLLEKDIGERRPAYRDYIAHTNAFFPWFPKADSMEHKA